MSKNKTVNRKAGGKKTVKLEDFFTVELNRKRKKIKKKLERIKELNNKQKNKLTDLQKELIGKKDSLKDQTTYYDDIEALYFKAYEKNAVDKPAKTEVENNTKVDESKLRESIIDSLSESLSKLSTVGSYFSCPKAAEEFTKKNPEVLKNYSQDFISGVVEVWKITSGGNDQAQQKNSAKSSVCKSEIKNYLSKSNLLSSAAKLPYNRIVEGVERIANEQIFKESSGYTEKEVEVVPEVTKVTTNLLAENNVESQNSIQSQPKYTLEKIQKKDRKRNYKKHDEEEYYSKKNTNDEYQKKNPSPPIVQKEESVEVQEEKAEEVKKDSDDEEESPPPKKENKWIEVRDRREEKKNKRNTDNFGRHNNNYRRRGRGGGRGRGRGGWRGGRGRDRRNDDNYRGKPHKRTYYRRNNNEDNPYHKRDDQYENQQSNYQNNDNRDQYRDNGSNRNYQRTDEINE